MLRPLTFTFQEGGGQVEWRRCKNRGTESIMTLMRVKKGLSNVCGLWQVNPLAITRLQVSVCKSVCLSVWVSICVSASHRMTPWRALTPRWRHTTVLTSRKRYWMTAGCDLTCFSTKIITVNHIISCDHIIHIISLLDATLIRFSNTCAVAPSDPTFCCTCHKSLEQLAYWQSQFSSLPGFKRSIRYIHLPSLIH